MRKGLIFLCFQFTLFSVFSQNINYARKIVDTLTTEYFAGRGVINNGEKKAANYIANQFKKKGLKQFENSFFQEFNSPLNTFPKTVSVSFDGNKITPGSDFIVGAASGSIKGTFELIWYKTGQFSDQKELDKLVKKGFFANKFIILDNNVEENESDLFQQLKLNKVGAVGVIFLEDKLTQHLSATAKNYAILHVKRGVLKQTYKSISVVIDQELSSDTDRKT